MVSVDPGVEFLEVPRAFTLHNSTPEWITIRWDGEEKKIPPNDQVVYPHPKYEDVCYSAKYLGEDAYIPGTLVLRDIFQQGPMGSTKTIWSASQAIKNVLGIDPKSKKYEGAYAKRGLSVLPEHPTREQVKLVEDAGKVRWREWRIDQAARDLAQWEHKQGNLKQAGLQPLPAPPEIREARALLKAADDVQSRKYRAALTPEERRALSEDFDEGALNPMAAPSTDQLLDSLLENEEVLEKLAAKLGKRPPKKAKKKQESYSPPEDEILAGV